MVWGWLALGAFFVVWIGVSIYGKSQKWSVIMRIGGGFLLACSGLAIGGLLLESEINKNIPAPAAPKVVEMPAVAIKDHNYVMQDGMKYGYPAAISETARQAGQAAENLVMALYAGEKDGKFQAHILDGVTVTALECSSPCQYLKIMTYVDSDYLRDQIKVEHISANPNSLGFMIMQDAMRGKLKRYGVGTETKRYTVWVDEQKGMKRTPMPKS